MKSVSEHVEFRIRKSKLHELAFQPQLPVELCVEAK